MHKPITDTAPVRAISIPIVQRANLDALALLQKAPRRQRWTLTPKEAQV